MTASATSTRRRLWLRAWVRRAETLQSRLVPKAPGPVADKLAEDACSAPDRSTTLMARRRPQAWSRRPRQACGARRLRPKDAGPGELGGGQGPGAKGPSSLSERSATGTATQEPSASALRPPASWGAGPTRSPSPQASMTRRADTEGERTVKDRERPRRNSPWR